MGCNGQARLCTVFKGPRGGQFVPSHPPNTARLRSFCSHAACHTQVAVARTLLQECNKWVPPADTPFK